MATSIVVAGKRLTKLLITGCRISASTLRGNGSRGDKRHRQQKPARNARATSPSPGQRVTGQRVLAYRQAKPMPMMPSTMPKYPRAS
jgi:hypothetical protein